ncbi:aminoacylase-1-like isoform X2 [Contarinia nasturtii]|uniref:aminoacylase-1-like isoform X2 n=1 Tax=Contarinia nasturtii TaxID=265458 RepID=UPI0012D3CA62|nr:aminoacylase-1-like isoform X2 [Contarinia nasturtii]
MYLRYLFTILIIFAVCQYITFANEERGFHDVTKQTDKLRTVVSNSTTWESNEEIQLFREYLRIPSVHPNVDYKPCIAFLEKQAASLNLPVSISYPARSDKPVVVMTWEGSQPELPSIMLNSHMDVVPAFEKFWTHPPFAAEIDGNGDIFARGAQDMKSNAMQYLAAVRALKRDGIDRLKRTVHITFVPDEEVGHDGMASFVKTNEFIALNVAFTLDEGGLILNYEGVLYVFKGERTMWQVEFIFHGTSEHGARLFPSTPGEKMSYVVGKLMALRAEELKKFTEMNHLYENVTTINLTILKGGILRNIVPAEMSATFDIRIAVSTSVHDFEEMVNKWCAEAGGNISINFLDKGENEQVTRTDSSNPFWMAFKTATEESGIKVKPVILGGASDNRYLRRVCLKISAIGFSPLINTIPKLHDHNEYINVETFLKGIQIYKKIIYNLGNV